ncbi:hypothetical protein RP29_06095 [Acidovorax temperans]|uniref:Uncharacterized protein n=1 Tax=Acidovorax temperans TaxID=80878 RepID=A0A0D7KBC0_9BURK|nr:hypothetical protein RP29_06095 [Acidovorax temperans]
MTRNARTTRGLMGRMHQVTQPLDAYLADRIRWKHKLAIREPGRDRVTGFGTGTAHMASRRKVPGRLRLKSDLSK